MQIDTLVVRALRSAMAGIFFFVWCLAPTLNAVAATDEERAAAFSSQLQASLTALEDGDRDAPRDHWDPQYVVDQVGIEPSDLFHWVRDSVVWMPYRGLLRGPQGVLMDRVGNSLDQSLLLARLLQLAGYNVRLGHATLSDAAVDVLWKQIEAARASQPAATALVGTAVPDVAGREDALTTADLYGIDRTNVADVLASTNAEAAGLSADMATRIFDETARLSQIVGPLDGTTLAADIIAAAHASLADHWWVQVQRDGGRDDLDLLGDDTGGPVTSAAETLDPDALLADLEQRVVVRVVTEQLKDNQLSDSVILEQSVRPRDMLGTTLGFRHFPMAWPQQWPQVTPDDIQVKLRAALYAQTEWMPVLVAGDAVLGTQGVHDTGELDPNPHPVNPFMQLSVGMIGQLSRATDALATGGDPDKLLPDDPDLVTPRPPRPEGELVAEWLEYETQVPGQGPVITRREIFDLVGPAARASGDISGFAMSGEKALTRSMAMLGESEIQILPSRLAPEFLTHLGAENALGNRPVLDELARDPFGKLPSNFMELFSKLNGMPAALYTQASLRFDINPLSAWIYVDRPSIVAQHTRLTRVGGGDFAAQIELDIVENGVGVDPMAADAATELRLSQGVSDTNAEAVALTKIGHVTVNAAEAFAAAPADQPEWSVIGPADVQELQALGYGADISAQITEALRSGRLVVLPPRPAEVGSFPGFWQIDSATGTTLGIGPSGHGQAMVEYALIIIIETMMAAAQCALEASLTKALEKTLAEKAKGSSSDVATGAGARAGYEQAKNDLGNSNFRNRCIALGMFAGFRSLLIGFALHAARTSGDKGYDGSKQANSYERNANNNARTAAQNPGARAGPAPGAGNSASPGPGNTRAASPGGPPPGTSPPGRSASPPAAPPQPQPPPPLKGDLGRRPVPNKIEAAEAQKAKADLDLAQQSRDAARQRLDEAEDNFAAKPRDPEALADKQLAQKDYDSASRNALDAQHRQTLAEAEQRAYDANQAYAAQKEAMTKHVESGGKFSGPEWDAWDKAFNANEAAHSDFMKARFSQLAPHVAPATPVSSAPSGQTGQSANTAGLLGITSALGGIASPAL